MGPGKHLYGRTLPGGVDPKAFDYFHELVVIQELVRIGAPGYMAGAVTSPCTLLECADDDSGQKVSRPAWL